MAAIDKKKLAIVKKFIAKRRKRRKQFVKGMTLLLKRRQLMLKAMLVAMLLLLSRSQVAHHYRSCRRLLRNSGWWEKVWNHHDDKRFKQTFRVSRSTFNLILSRIRHKLERQTLCEEPISPELCLAICLYRMGRGDYSIAEMVGLARPTVTMIVNEVNHMIVSCLWQEFVSSHMPKTEEEFRSKILDMEEMWQFPSSWAAVDGCHIPMKCPPGGNSTRKGYHNFKNFYSIVLMALVDARYRFVWGTCGFPGNSHDSIILQATSLWSDINDGKVLPDFCQDEQGVHIPPLILGDSAFPFKTYLMKPYANAILSKQQRYFNYRLSRARMVIEGAFGQLKGRWRFLLRKSESNTYETKIATLACMVLHNICLDNGDTIPKKLDLTTDPATSQRRDRSTICDLLLMKSSCRIFDSNENMAVKVRKTIEIKLWRELGF